MLFDRPDAQLFSVESLRNLFPFLFPLRFFLPLHLFSHPPVVSSSLLRLPPFAVTSDCLSICSLFGLSASLFPRTPASPQYAL